MTLDQMMPKHYPEAVGIHLEGRDVKLDSIVADIQAVMVAKGYSNYGMSRLVLNQRELVYLNEVDAEATREAHHASCRNSVGSFPIRPLSEIVPACAAEVLESLSVSEEVPTVVEDVWTALEDDVVEAASLRIRSQLMRTINRVIKTWEVTQQETAQRLGLSVEDAVELTSGLVDKFTVDALIKLLPVVGLQANLSLHPRD